MEELSTQLSRCLSLSQNGLLHVVLSHPVSRVEGVVGEGRCVPEQYQAVSRLLEALPGKVQLERLRRSEVLVPANTA
jgi:hypothetical protein